VNVDEQNPQRRTSDALPAPPATIGTPCRRSHVGQTAMDMTLCYRNPGAPFCLAIESLEALGEPKDRILHVAQSRFHDIAPAHSLGLKTAWIDRRRAKAGSGAPPPSSGRPDAEFPDLRSLADRLLG